MQSSYFGKLKKSVPNHKTPENDRMEAFCIVAGEEEHSILMRSVITIIDDFIDVYPQIQKILFSLSQKPNGFLEVLFSKWQPHEKPQVFTDRLTREALTVLNGGL